MLRFIWPVFHEFETFQESTSEKSPLQPRKVVPAQSLLAGAL